MACLHNHDQILEFRRKIFLKGFQIYQNYLCALRINYSILLTKLIKLINVFEINTYTLVGSLTCICVGSYTRDRRLKVSSERLGNTISGTGSDIRYLGQVRLIYKLYYCNS